MTSTQTLIFKGRQTKTITWFEDFRFQWQAFWRMYHLWWRLEDLSGLILWAERKRLPHVRYYRYLYESSEIKLGKASICSIALSKWAYRCYKLVSLADYILRTKRFQSGAARKYQYRYL